MKNAYKSIDLITIGITKLFNELLTSIKYRCHVTSVDTKTLALNNKTWKYKIFYLRAYDNNFTEKQPLDDYNVMSVDLMQNLIPSYMRAVLKEKNETRYYEVLVNLYKKEIQNNMRRLNQLYVNIKVK